MVKSACGIEAVYMCFNGTGIWGGETIYDFSANQAGNKFNNSLWCECGRKIIFREYYGDLRASSRVKRSILRYKCGNLFFNK